MTTSRIELEAVKAAALAKGFDWADSQQWYEGHLEAEIIVAPTDQAPGSDPMRTGPARVRRELTVHVDSQEYAVGKDQILGVCSRALMPDSGNRIRERSGTRLAD